jgi:hypothetical protein
MSISRRTDRENRLWADLPEPASLTPALARQIVSAVIGGDPNRADELANLLLTLERELVNCEDYRVDAVIEQIDRLVEIAFQQSEPYYDYLDVYRMTVNQRCRKTTIARPALSADPAFQDLIFLVVRGGKRRAEPN